MHQQKLKYAPQKTVFKATAITSQLNISGLSTRYLGVILTRLESFLGKSYRLHKRVHFLGKTNGQSCNREVLDNKVAGPKRKKPLNH